MLYPEYVGTFARAGTRFSVITPQISAAGVEHLDTLFRPTSTLSPAAARHDAILRSGYDDQRFALYRRPEHRGGSAGGGSLGIGTPVLFRGLEVGTVTGLSLGSMSDRVMVKLRISKRYQYGT
nr:Uncharacterised protein [Klebsiella pneumoniae]